MEPGVITTADIDARINRLRAKEQELKRENRRTSDEIRELRMALYALVDLKKDIIRNGTDDVAPV